MSITDHLIAFCTAPTDRAACEMMRLSLFDWAACGIAGAQEGGFDRFQKSIGAQGGQGEAMVFGGALMPAPAAALINGTLSHALDFDDTHFAHIGHPSVAVAPAALAVAQREGRDFDAMFDAALIGVEASIHVGLWLGRDHYQIGFHQTATAGAFGATLAAARLLGLSEVETRHALGLCASLASGIKAQFGTGGKPLNAGLAARSGVEAALWAQCGMSAAADGLAGPLGFGPTHHGAQDETHLAALGKTPWQILSISHKLHACCHGLHAMLEALDGVSVDAQEIESIEVKTHPRWLSVCNIPEPDTGLASKFSYRHTAAMAMLGKSTAQRNMFSDVMAQDAEVLALRRKVTVKGDTDLSEMQAEVTIMLTCGKRIDVSHDLAAPLPEAIRQQKLRSKATDLLGAARETRLWSAIKTSDMTGFLETIGSSERGEQ
ncbi:hypothetical protein ROLI_021780 [Roseobacter fucihabitans]|uniref:MmgE/PrpD family protein n=1 Tax=Roseobacter fucihabitans TaxID=1537242 RepID=A0ABZ2BVA5_9RHOB|nr:MmgE/PrpD family protein [Roseobacter litoralis]MBC6967748.1 MmgE/PrpD family protein [Roseobacter litoralis]